MMRKSLKWMENEYHMHESCQQVRGEDALLVVPLYEALKLVEERETVGLDLL